VRRARVIYLAADTLKRMLAQNERGCYQRKIALVDFFAQLDLKG